MILGGRGTRVSAHYIYFYFLLPSLFVFLLKVPPGLRRIPCLGRVVDECTSGHGLVWVVVFLGGHSCHLPRRGRGFAELLISGGTVNQSIYIYICVSYSLLSNLKPHVIPPLFPTSDTPIPLRCVLYRVLCALLLYMHGLSLLLASRRTCDPDIDRTVAYTVLEETPRSWSLRMRSYVLEYFMIYLYCDRVLVMRGWETQYTLCCLLLLTFIWGRV